MKKLRLELDELRVDTFATTPMAGDEKGTVHGHVTWTCETLPFEDTDTTCPPPTARATCANSCYGSCYGSCNASCQGSCYITCPGANCPFVPEGPTD